MKQQLHIKLSVPIILLACVLGGCIWCYCHFMRKPLLDSRLIKADSLMFISPAYSLKILNNIESTQQFDETNKAFYALLLTQAQYRNYEPVKSDSLIKVALNYYDVGDDEVHCGWANFYAGQIYRDQGETHKAVLYFGKAAKAAEKSGDNRLLHYVFYHWGELLQNKKPYNEGLNKFKKAEKYARLINDTLKIYYSLDRIGWSNLLNHDYVNATKEFHSALSLVELVNDNIYRERIHKSLALTYLLRKEFPEAKYHIDKAVELRNYADEDSFSMYSIKGDILTEIGMCDSAEIFLKKGKRSKTLYNRLSYNQRISKLEAKRGNYRKAYEYSVLYSETFDSITRMEEDDRTMALEKQYDNSTVREEKNVLEMQNKRKTIALLAGALILVSLLFVSYFVSVRMRRHARILQENASHSSQQLKEKNNTLKNEILSNSNSVGKIERLLALNDKDKIALEQEFKFNKEEEDDLLRTMSLCDKNFVQNIEDSCKNLTKADLMLCCLQRLNLKNRDIAILLGVSLPTLKKRKTRLKNEKLKSVISEEQLFVDFVDPFHADKKEVKGNSTLQ